MRLPKPIRERLHAEFRFAADNMAATSDLAQKLYFFSALFGEANRAMNQHWDPELALMHLVLTSAHGEMMGRLTQPAPLGVGLSGVPGEVPDALTRVAGALAELFGAPEQDTGELHQLLARISEVAYTVTGNGYYLYLKGAVKL